MKGKIKLFFTIISVLLNPAFAGAQIVHNWEKPSPQASDIAPIIFKIFYAILGAGAVVVAIYIFFALILYLTASGDEGRIKQAGSTFWHSVLGITAIIAGAFFVGYLQNHIGEYV